MAGRKVPQDGDSSVACAYCLEEDAEFNVDSTSMDDEAAAPICGWCEGRSRTQEFASFREKRQFLLEERRKSRRAVNSWTQQDIDELGPTMRAYIINAQHEEKRRRVTSILKSKHTSRRILEMLLEEFPELRAEFGGESAKNLAPVQVGRPVSFKEPRMPPPPVGRPAPGVPPPGKKPLASGSAPSQALRPVAVPAPAPAPPATVAPAPAPAVIQKTPSAVQTADAVTKMPAPQPAAAPAGIGLLGGIRQLFQRRKPTASGQDSPSSPMGLPPTTVSPQVPRPPPQAHAPVASVASTPPQTPRPRPIVAPSKQAGRPRAPLNRWWVTVLETGNWELVAEDTQKQYFRIEIEFPRDPACWEIGKGGIDYSRPKRPQDMSAGVADLWLQPDLWAPCEAQGYMRPSRQRANIEIPQGWAPVTAFLDDAGMEQLRAHRGYNPWLGQIGPYPQALAEWRKIFADPGLVSGSPRVRSPARPAAATSIAAKPAELRPEPPAPPHMVPAKQPTPPENPPIPVPVATVRKPTLNWRRWITIQEGGNWEIVIEPKPGSFRRLMLPFPEDSACWEKRPDGRTDYSRPRRPLALLEDIESLLRGKATAWENRDQPPFVKVSDPLLNVVIDQGWAPCTTYLDESALEFVENYRQDSNPWLETDGPLAAALTKWRRLYRAGGDEGGPDSAAGELLAPDEERDLAWLSAHDDSRDDEEAAANLGVTVAEFAAWREVNGIPAHKDTRLSQDKDLERFAAYEETASDDDAAARLGIHPATFAGWRKSHNLEAKRKRRQRVDLSAIDDLAWMDVYDRTKSDVDAANELKTTVSTFVAWRKAHNLEAKRWEAFAERDEALYRKAYDDNSSDLAASKQLGISYSRFTSWRAKQGLAAKGAKPVPIDHEARQAAYEDTNSDREAADRLGITIEAFKTWRKTTGLPSQGGEIRDAHGRVILKGDRDVRFFGQYVAGMNDNEAGAALGTSSIVIGRWRARLSLPPNRDGKCNGPERGIDLRSGELIGRADS